MMAGFLIVIVLFVVPIPLVVGYWGRSAVAQNPIRRAGRRLVWALTLAAYYGFFPSLIAPYIRVNPLLSPPAPDQVDGLIFFTLLVILASIFIALASQQATYVIRLDEIRRKNKHRKPEATAAYFLVSCGFWAFSFAASVTLGLIAVYLLNGDSFTFGIYEAIIAVLFVGGWIVLMAGALIRFETSGRL